MGYMHIDNLYKIPDFLTRFDRLYALEKIHGTSAHIRWDGSQVTFFSGGVKHDAFIELFDEAYLFGMLAPFDPHVIYGEAYGGSCQKMSHTYGDKLRFVAFDVKIGDNWLTVPEAEKFVKGVGLEFVYYNEIPSTLDAANAERDRPSTQAVRNGITDPKITEGVILRPVTEVTFPNGKRAIAKHKRVEFMEHKTPREVDPTKIKVLEDAKAIAEEWVTPMRLTHVLDKLPSPGIEETGLVIRAMLEDIRREGDGEIVWTKEAERAVGKAAADLFKRSLRDSVA
jgi:hypothetical protein